MKKTLISAIVWGAAAAGISFNCPGEDSLPFGFSGKEIFPIDPQISHMKAVDLDGDGMLDIVLANNARSRVTLLYNKTGKTEEVLQSLAEQPREINELPPDSRFQIDSIASEKRIASLDAVDLNSDGLPDIAYYGEPKELVIHYNEGDGKWSTPNRIPIRDGQINANGLVHGDLNGDQRTDLVLLAENHIYLLAQDENHQLGEPEIIPFSDTVRGLQILDIDGDGKEDMLQVNWESPYPVRFRLQNEIGKLGPEFHFALQSIRSYWADDLDGDGKAEMITIATKSGRAQVATFVKESAAPLAGDFKIGQFQTLPLRHTDKAQRGVAWADVNRDSLVDLLVAEPDSGQLTLFLQGENGQLSVPRTFPSLSGISEIDVADWDDDGVPEIFLLSTTERQVGVTRLEESGRIPFPTILPIEGRPLAIAAGKIRPEEPASLAVLNDDNGKRSLQIHSSKGAITSQALSEKFKSNPSSLTIHDADQDGLPDLVALIPYEKIKILVRKPDESEFDEIDVSPPGGNTSDPWMSVADVDADDKPEMLLAQKNFVRAVVLTKDETRPAFDGSPMWSLKVKDQINGSSSDSEIVGASALSGGEDSPASIFLLDKSKKALTLCTQDENGVWTVTRNLEIPVSQFSRLQSIGLGSQPPNCIALIGLNAVSWMPLEGETWAIEPLAGYETQIKDGWLMDVVAGDLNQDHRKDLVFLEGVNNHIDLVQFEPPHELKSSLQWRVFEKHTFRNRREMTVEPREAVVADFTNDGKNDLAIVVHDRVLLYPQE